MRTTAAVLLTLALGGPSAAGAEPPAQLEWVRPGFAEGWALGAADLNGDGHDELVYGGRGIAALDAASLATRVPRWTVKWASDPDNVLDGGDNTWVTGMELTDVTGDGVPDVLVTTSNTDAYLVDGADGRKLWHNPRTGGFLSSGFALVGTDDEPLLFATGGKTAISARTGEVAWQADLPSDARRVAAGQLDGEAGTDVVVGVSPPGFGTSPASIVGALTAPTVFGFSAAGEKLFEYPAVSGVQSVATADIDGAGSDVAIVGTFNGVVHAVGADGVPRWSAATGHGPVNALAVADITGDGRQDVLAGIGHGLNSMDGRYEVVALSALGVPLWRHEVGEPVEALEVAQLDDGPAPQLLVAAGRRGWITGSGGVAVALDTDFLSVDRERWRLPLAQGGMSLAVAERDGRRLVAVGAGDALLRIVDGATGKVVHTWASGGYVRTVASGDLSGDGLTEVASGDDQGVVAVTRPDGTEAWARRLDVGSDGDVTDLAVGDVDGDGAVHLAAAGRRLFQSGDRGVVELYRGDGSLRWRRGVPGAVAAVRIADLDGDGRPEIVVAEEGSPCSVAVLDPQTGATRWRTGISDCLSPRIAVGDVDGDGVLEVAYAELTLFEEPRAALIEADGSVRWDLAIAESTAWIDVVDGGVVHGGFGAQAGGHVTRRAAADGSVAWQTVLPRTEGRGGASRHGRPVPDLDGDGMRELVVSTDVSDVRLLDGATGAIRWQTLLEPVDTHVTQAHQSGPVVWLEPGKGRPPLIVAAQWSIGRARSQTFALTPSGEIVAEFAMEGEAWGAAPARFAGERAGVVVGAGLGLYAIGA